MVARVAAVASGALRDLARQRRCGRADLRLRHQQIGEAHRRGFVTRDAAARVERQRRLLRADQPRQGLGQAEAGMVAQSGEVRAEPRFRAGHPEIRDDRKAEAADRRAMHAPR